MDNDKDSITKYQVELSMSNVQLQQSKLKHFQMFLNDFETGYTKCKEEILTNSEELINRINQHKSRLLQELDEFRDSELKKYGIFENGLAEKKAKLNSLSNLCDKLLNNEGMAFMQMFNTHRDEYESLKLKTQVVDKALLELTSISFHPVKCNTAFGSLKIKKPKVLSKPYQMKRRASLWMDGNATKQLMKSISPPRILPHISNTNMKHSNSQDSSTNNGTGNGNVKVRQRKFSLQLSPPSPTKKSSFNFPPSFPETIESSCSNSFEMDGCDSGNSLPDDDDPRQLELLWSLEKEGRYPGEINCPTDVTFLADETIVVSDRGNSRLQFFGTNGEHLKVVAANKIKPFRVTTDCNNHIVISDSIENCIKVFKNDGSYLTTLGKRLFKSGVSFHEPCAIACTSLEHYIVSDLDTNDVLAYNSEGKIVKTFESEFKKPSYISSYYDKILVSDNLNHCVKVFDLEYNYLFDCMMSRATQSGSSESHDYLQYPNGVCMDHLGNIYVADWGAHRITMFHPDGEYVADVLTKDDGLFYPAGVAILDNYLAVTNYSESNSSVMLFEFV